MQDGQLHLPDFGVPDFAQPALEGADLAQPGLRLPDPLGSEVLKAEQALLWPVELEALDTLRPDPALPDVLEPELPKTLSLPATGLHMLPEAAYAPDVVMRERPGEMGPAALVTLTGSPDLAQLPAGIDYPQLYTTQDEMNRRARHLGMLEMGLEQSEEHGR